MRWHSIGLLAVMALFLSRRAGSSSPLPSPPPPASPAPQEEQPWASIGKTLQERPREFRALAPGIYRQLQSDALRPDLFEAWGRSLGYDELAHGLILAPGLYSVLAETANFPVGERKELPTSSGPVVHAGLEHTYGYLFSILNTPFGFKRARWVRPTLDQGLGLPRCTLCPEPAKGTLLSNLTYVLGRLVLRDTPSWKLISKLGASAPPELRNWSCEGLQRKSLKESVEIPGPGGKPLEVTLRTDFFKFPNVTMEPANTHLLVYTVTDPRSAPAPSTRLITAFPVTTAFLETVFDPKNLGRDKPISSRYNAYIPGLTGAALKGVRKIAE